MFTQVIVFVVIKTNEIAFIVFTMADGEGKGGVAKADLSHSQLSRNNPLGAMLKCHAPAFWLSSLLSQ